MTFQEEWKKSNLVSPTNKQKFIWNDSKRPISADALRNTARKKMGQLKSTPPKIKKTDKNKLYTSEIIWFKALADPQYTIREKMLNHYGQKYAVTIEVISDYKNKYESPFQDVGIRLHGAMDMARVISMLTIWLSSLECTSRTLTLQSDMQINYEDLSKVEDAFHVSLKCLTSSDNNLIKICGLTEDTVELAYKFLKKFPF